MFVQDFIILLFFIAGITVSSCELRSLVKTAQGSQIRYKRTYVAAEEEVQPGWVSVSWPHSSFSFGQVSAVTLDEENNVYVFHRGDRVWNANTFRNDIFQQNNLGPIKNNTIIKFDSIGTILHERRSGMFYMPHGLTVDHEKNLWVTDVALHQVIKLSPSTDVPLLTLGEQFVPGKDSAHFCKPTSVAISSTNGDFFVADGYCNSRILKFNNKGVKILEWGRSAVSIGTTGMAAYGLSIPHALALVESQQLICVADREGGRIPCFDSNNSTYIKEFQSGKIGSRIFSIAYSPAHGGQMYLVNGPVPNVLVPKVQGFVLSMDLGNIVSEFGPELSNPHDVAVTPDGNTIYVAEIDPFKVWKFVRNESKMASDSVSSHKEFYLKPAFGSPGNLTGAILVTSSCLVFAAAILVAVFIYTKNRKPGSPDTMELLAKTID